MEVFKLLPKTNCKKCNKPTCLAFAAQVFQGRVFLHECPYIDEKLIKKYGDKRNSLESEVDLEYQKRLALLKNQLIKIDLKKKAPELGGKFNNGRLTLKILGKDFSVDQKGNISTDIHVNRWITPPIYSYIIHSKGLPLSGQWVSFRELESSPDWHLFFNHQCVKALKELADTHTEFFENILTLFNGKKVKKHFDSDISLVIYPFPKLPILICYNKPEDGLTSTLNLFFDSTTDKNIHTKDLYILCNGFAVMLKKISITHG